MNPFAPRGPTRLTGLLALACVALLAVIYVELEARPLASGEVRSIPSAAAAETPVASVPQADLEFELPPLATYSEIAARPLFAPTRRPAPPELAPPEPEEPAVDRGEFYLRGVATAGDNRRVALLERRATGELLRALEGQTVDGWRVASITPRTVILDAGGDSYTLEVQQDDPLQASPAANERRRGLLPERLRARLGGDQGQQQEVPQQDEEMLPPELEQPELELEAEQMEEAESGG